MIDLGGVVEIRPLRAEDATVIAAAFAAIGWNKPAELYVRYAQEQAAGSCVCWVATVDSKFAGYVALRWVSDYPGVAGTGIPEIQDLNVLPAFRRRGIATRLLDHAEEAARSRASTVGIGVGLHPGYNAAQRLYVKRGYVPDGWGVTYHNRFVQEGEAVRMDDALVLHFLKELESP